MARGDRRFGGLTRHRGAEDWNGEQQKYCERQTSRHAELPESVPQTLIRASTAARALA
jgi:hypothetical protein